MDALTQLEAWAREEMNRATFAANLAATEMAAALNTGSAASLPSAAASLASLTRWQARVGAMADIVKQVERLRGADGGDG